MIILLCTITNANELVVDYAVDTDTDTKVVVPSVHPAMLGGEFNIEIGEWVINA